MALTATAGPRVQQDVRTQLEIPHCVTFKLSFNRPNLRWEGGVCICARSAGSGCLNIGGAMCRGVYYPTT